MSSDRATAGLHHVQLAIPTGGEERARAFWGGVLGLAELAKPPVLAARGGCWFRGGRLEVHLGVQEPFTPATKAHPGILVTDLDDIARRLVEAGHPVRRDGDFPGFDRMSVDDPFGNRVELLERRGPGCTIRFPAPADEDDVRAAQAELLPDGFWFASGLDEADDFAAWCATTRANADGDQVPPDWVPSTFHVAELHGTVVARVWVRHELNEVLRAHGGHIGYGVRPAWHGRGIAPELLRFGLDLLADRGLTSALVTCADDHRASIAVVERAGGLLRDVAVVDGRRSRRYDVATGA